MSRVGEAVAPRRLGRRFRWLLASSWVSNLGDGFALAAGPLLVAAETRDPTLVALATLLQRLPWLLFAVLAGVIADRHDRARIVVVVDTVRGVLVALLALSIVTSVVDIAVVLAALFLLGAAEVFSNTASNAILPSLVDRDDLTLANARLQGGFYTVYQLVGPPVGAVLVTAGMAVPFVAQAGLVMAGAGLMARVGAGRAAPPGGPPAERRMRAEVAEGFRWVRSSPAVRTLVLTILIFNVTFGAAWSVLVLWSQERLHMGDLGFGVLTAASAAGGVAGIAAYGRITKRVSLGNMMRVGLLIETFTHLAFALTTSQVVAVVIMTVFGAHAFVWGTTSVTVRQLAVPDELRGRVNAINSLGVFGGIVVGSALGGPIATRFGITAPFWFAFVGSAVFVVAIWRQLAHVAHDDQPAGSVTPA
ncbi:MAG TPA: MFS transporter [Acidimicrobiales bacterium]|nr:MFS transporter [Acidimicrobiales bacterium]